MSTTKQKLDGSRLWQRKTKEVIFHMQMLTVKGIEGPGIGVTTFLNGDVGYLHNVEGEHWVWRLSAETYGVPDGFGGTIVSPTTYKTEADAETEMRFFVSQNLKTRIDE